MGDIIKVDFGLTREIKEFFIERNNSWAENTKVLKIVPTGTIDYKRTGGDGSKFKKGMDLKDLPKTTTILEKLPTFYIEYTDENNELGVPDLLPGEIRFDTIAWDESWDDIFSCRNDHNVFNAVGL